MNVVSLLQQRVPGHADVCQLRHLFAPQSGRSTAAARRQANIRGSQARAARAQKIGERLVAFSLIHVVATLCYTLLPFATLCYPLLPFAALCCPLLPYPPS